MNSLELVNLTAAASPSRRIFRRMRHRAASRRFCSRSASSLIAMKPTAGLRPEERRAISQSAFRLSGERQSVILSTHSVVASEAVAHEHPILVRTVIASRWIAPGGGPPE